MGLFTTTRIVRLPYPTAWKFTVCATRQVQRVHFHQSTSVLAKNRVFNSVRNEEEFSSLLLLSASNRTPLITFWTASWCPSCRTVGPIIQRLIEQDHIGEDEGGVGFAEIEADIPDTSALALRYTVSSIPTLLSFSRQEAQLATRTANVHDMKNVEFLKDWIRVEARRGGQGGGGGTGFLGPFGR